jgi:hypothetical protein
MLRGLIRFLSSFWFVEVLVTVGWGPLFIAEFVRRARPDLDDGYILQHFAMQWIRTTATCSFFAIAAAIVWIIRFILSRFTVRAAQGRS